MYLCNAVWCMPGDAEHERSSGQVMATVVRGCVAAGGEGNSL